MKSVKRFSILLVGVALCALSSQAQTQDEPPLPKDPTPLIQLVTPQEQAEINKDPKPRRLVEVYLKIAVAHLQNARDRAKDGDAKATERELDIYNKALDESAKLAFQATDDRRKLSKKIEQTVYENLKTLELVERYSPMETMPFAEFATKHAKYIRTQAINISFDSGKVLHEKEGETKPPEESKKIERKQPDLIKPAGMLADAKQPSLLVTMLEPPQLANDYLTEEEDDFVRQAQEPDLRIKVFMKIADRRLIAITGEGPKATDKKDAKKLEEEEQKWGKLPELDRAGYLHHYARAIDEAMAKLDDAYERNPKSSSLVKALKILGEATERQLKTLHALEMEMKTEKEKEALSDAIEKAETANKGASNGLKKPA